MSRIRIGVVGHIVSGQEQGRYVMVEDDGEHSGGYLVLTAADPRLSAGGEP